MTLLFGGVTAYLYLHFRASLNASIDNGLKARAADLSGLGRFPGPTAHLALPADRYGFAQVLDRSGQVLDASAGLPGRPLLRPAEITRAFSHPLFINRSEATRLYAARASQGRLVVAGVSLAQHERAMERLDTALGVGLPLALILSTELAYLLTGRMLAPVERMRQQAAYISAEDLDVRLPLPAGDDEIRRLGLTLNAMLDRLHASLERERRFVTDASHELRTPLALLKGELEVAMRINRTTHEWRDTATSATEEADRVITLAEQLLTLARAQEDHHELDRTIVSAHKLLAESAGSFRRSAELAGRSLVVADGASPALYGDAARIRQGLEALIDNALRHGAGPIILSAIDRDGWLELHVRDRGRGFPDEFLPRAFDRFTRADSARTRGGSGLGLAIADAIARLHGGTAHARNAEDGGADVWLQLPAAERADRLAGVPEDAEFRPPAQRLAGDE